MQKPSPEAARSHALQRPDPYGVRSGVKHARKAWVSANTVKLMPHRETLSLSSSGRAWSIDPYALSEKGS